VKGIFVTQGRSSIEVSTPKGSPMAITKLNKEMVDLLTKVKKHLREKHQISISLADPDVLDKLVELRGLPDALLQGMLYYLMALAGPEWSAKINRPPATGTAPASAEEHREKKLFSFRQSNTETAAPAQETADTQKKPVRYYRGQPIYD